MKQKGSKNIFDLQKWNTSLQIYSSSQLLQRKNYLGYAKVDYFFLILFKYSGNSFKEIIPTNFKFIEGSCATASKQKGKKKIFDLKKLITTL